MPDTNEILEKLTSFVHKANAWMIERGGAFLTWFFDPANQLLGILLGSFLTLLGVFLVNKNALKAAKNQREYEENVRKSKFRIEKLEELYILLARWGDVVSTQLYLHAVCMDGRMTYVEYNSESFNAMDAKSVEMERLHLLIDAYAPDIGKYWSILLKLKKGGINKIEAEFEQHYNQYNRTYSDDEKGSKIADYQDKCSIFNELMEDLKKRIAGEIRYGAQ